MAGFLDSIGEKLGMRGGDDKMQYLLAGALVLVIVISLVATFASFFGDGSTSGGRKEMHYWCTETKQEVVLSPEQMKPGEMLPPMGPGGGMQMVNPDTGRATLVPMMQCPKCTKWFLPEGWEDPRGMMMPNQQLVCTHCNTDVIQYQREQRKKKK